MVLKENASSTEINQEWQTWVEKRWENFIYWFISNSPRCEKTTFKNRWSSYLSLVTAGNVEKIKPAAVSDEFPDFLQWSLNVIFITAWKWIRYGTSNSRKMANILKLISNQATT